MNFEIPYMNVTTQEEAYNTVRSHLTPDMLRSFKVEINLTYNDSNYSVNAKGKGFELNANFTENSLKGKLDLSFLLKPLKGKIMGTLESKLKEVL